MYKEVLAPYKYLTIESLPSEFIILAHRGQFYFFFILPKDSVEYDRIV